MLETIPERKLRKIKNYKKRRQQIKKSWTNVMNEYYVSELICENLMYILLFMVTFMMLYTIVVFSFF